MALGFEYIVYGVVRVIAHGEVIVARLHYIRLVYKRIVMRKVALVNRDYNRFGSALRKLCGLVESDEFYRGNLYAVFFIEFGIGRLCINLHNRTACNVARVGDFDRYFEGIFCFAHARKRLRERGIRKAVAEGIAYLLVVVPARSACIGARDGICVALV